MTASNSGRNAAFLQHFVSTFCGSELHKRQVGWRGESKVFEIAGVGLDNDTHESSVQITSNYINLAFISIVRVAGKSPP